MQAHDGEQLTGVTGVNHRIAHGDCTTSATAEPGRHMIHRVTVGLVQVILLHNSAEKVWNRFINRGR
jgi:hypothetical protein